MMLWTDVGTDSIQFVSDGFMIKAFLARPGDDQGRAGARPGVASGQFPAVVVIHEWWGLNDHIQDIARRFAREGYVALAIDLYSRQGSRVTRDPAEAARLMESLSSQVVLRDLNAAVTYLKSQPFVDPPAVGVVGFCMGGTLVLNMAAHNSDIKAAVPFYGKVPPVETFKYFLCPILFHHGAKDTWVTTREVETLRQGLRDHGKPGEVVSYPEAGHAFFNDARPEVYRKADAERSWQRTLHFFSEHLR